MRKREKDQRILASFKMKVHNDERGYFCGIFKTAE